MMNEYEILVDSCGAFSGWVYLGRCHFKDVHKIATQNVQGVGIYHVAVTGTLSRKEKREIALRHGLNDR